MLNWAWKLSKNLAIKFLRTALSSTWEFYFLGVILTNLLKISANIIWLERIEHPQSINLVNSYSKWMELTRILAQRFFPNLNQFFWHSTPVAEINQLEVCEFEVSLSLVNFPKHCNTIVWPIFKQFKVYTIDTFNEETQFSSKNLVRKIHHLGVIWRDQQLCKV